MEAGINDSVMHLGRYVPWDSSPRFLRFSEVQQPMKVLTRFFGDRINTHREELKVWRDFAVSYKQYKDSRNGAGHILFIYDQNIQLLEACYLLMMAFREEPWTRKEISDEVLKAGREQWFYFPDELSELQLANPYLILKKLFRDFSLPEYRDHLKEWAYAALYKNPIDEAVTSEDIIMVYENMLQLYSAAWIIYQTESGAPYLKRLYWTDVDEVDSAKKDEPEDQQEIEKANEDDNTAAALPQDAVVHPISLHPFHPVLTPAEKLGLNYLTETMVKLVPGIRSVTYLGSCPKPFTFYLLVLVDDEEKMPEHSMVSKIEDNLRTLAGIYVIVHKIASAVNGLKSKGKFWSLAFSRGINVYRSEDLQLPDANEISNEQDMAVRLASWNKYGIISKEFFHGAERYMEEGNARLSLFLLHQATEHALIGLLQVMFGYRQPSHNLFRLIKLTLLFTDEFSDIFQLDTDEGLKLFTLINDGYAKARYDENFLVEEEMVKAALEKVRLLMSKAKLVFKSNEKI
ncbi:HEPN domain-containing protein [Mucilaginibacter sp.]|jgi:HEPN domain-containing protein|uniref:HEPN domain-containing protein n=1 Tax=Mucilaginibacter sp. TaxID=1882438 RepID=UPI00356162C3